jgi:hypothetical protein
MSDKLVIAITERILSYSAFVKFGINSIKL